MGPLLIMWISPQSMVFPVFRGQEIQPLVNKCGIPIAQANLTFKAGIQSRFSISKYKKRKKE
jgi:hypothetical protein